MFGKNPIEKPLKGHDGSELQVVDSSPFYTIQGEGPYAGRPAVFLRLHGCNLACWFCDTQFSDPGDPWRRISELYEEVECAGLGRTNLLVITGGEPLRQNIGPFCFMMREAGWDIQIETAGTVWLRGMVLPHATTLVVSPKTPVVHPNVHMRAGAWKYVISASDTPHWGAADPGYVPRSNTQDKGKAAVLLARPPDGECPSNVYLSPMNEYDESKNARNKALVAELALRYGVTAGLQLHKELGVKEPGYSHD